MIDRKRTERPGWGISEPPDMTDVHGDQLPQNTFPEMIELAQMPVNPYLTDSELIDQTVDSFPDLIKEAGTIGADVAIKKGKKKLIVLAGFGIAALAVAIGAKLIYDHQKAQEEIEVK